jgi:hypothetical protein
MRGARETNLSNPQTMSMMKRVQETNAPEESAASRRRAGPQAGATRVYRGATGVYRGATGVYRGATGSAEVPQVSAEAPQVSAEAPQVSPDVPPVPA